MLIEKGAYINAVNENNDSALILAAFLGNNIKFINSIFFVRTKSALAWLPGCKRQTMLKSIQN